MHRRGILACFVGAGIGIVGEATGVGVLSFVGVSAFVTGLATFVAGPRSGGRR